MSCGGRLLNQEGTEYADFTSCEEDGTSGCCDSSDACVYDGECYEYDETSEINDLLMICSLENTWCPDLFAYDSVFDRCVVQEEACYDSDDKDYCNYIFGTDDVDDWESDIDGNYPCIQELTTPTSSAYYQGCLWQEVSGMDYYFYQDIEWY